MKKLAIVGFVVFASAAYALPGGGNADQNACFGQVRASHASTGFLHPIGLNAFSQRRGLNAEMNEDFREACQG